MTAKELLNLYVAKYLNGTSSNNAARYVTTIDQNISNLADNMPPGYREAYERGYADDTEEVINSIYLADQFNGLEDF